MGTLSWAEAAVHERLLKSRVISMVGKKMSVLNIVQIPFVEI